MKSALVISLILLGLAGVARAATDPIAKSFAKVDALIERGDYAKAVDALEEIRDALPPENPLLLRYHERIGAVRLREGAIPSARGAFTEVIKASQRLKIADDSVAKAYAGLGLCLRREGNDKYALKFFNKALALQLDEGTRMFVEDQIRELEGRRPRAAR